MAILYIIPLFTFLLNFLSLMSVIRFLINRQGLYWLIPFGLTVFLGLYNVLTFSSDTYGADTLSLYTPLVLSLLWYLAIITFHYALKKTVLRNRYLDDMKKNMNEARYQEKLLQVEYQQNLRHRKDLVTNSFTVPVIPEEDEEWVSINDRDIR